jgi:hypothetical protein
MNIPWSWPQVLFPAARASKLGLAGEVQILLLLLLLLQLKYRFRHFCIEQEDQHDLICNGRTWTVINCREIRPAKYFPGRNPLSPSRLRWNLPIPVPAPGIDTSPLHAYTQPKRQLKREEEDYRIGEVCSDLTWRGGAVSLCPVLAAVRRPHETESASCLAEAARSDVKKSGRVSSRRLVSSPRRRVEDEAARGFD